MLLFRLQASQVEDYFTSAGDNKTSDRTLARLSRLDVEEVNEAMTQVTPAPYMPLVKALQDGYTSCFHHWMYLLW